MSPLHAPQADLLSWVCSLTSILSVYFTPRRRLLGPIFGIIGIVPWTALAVVSRQWGLMPVTIIITALHLRTVLLWKPARRKAATRVIERERPKECQRQGLLSRQRKVPRIGMPRGSMLRARGHSMRVLLMIMLMLALPATGFAQDLTDTPEKRAALAKDLGDIEAPNIRRAMTDMMDALEQNVPLDQRQRFRAHLESLITYDTIRRYSDSAVAKDMSADELAALIAFYSSPIGHSVMLKLPLLARDTGALIQSLVEQALRQLPSDSGPLPHTPL